MFKSKNPNGTHDYLVYKDAKSNEVRAIELTHLYHKDKYRFVLLKQNVLKKMRLPHRETPSGVNNHYFVTNVHGKPIDLNHRDVNMNIYRKKRISKKQQLNIISFAKRKRK